MGIGTELRRKTGTAHMRRLRPAIAYVRKVANTTYIVSGCAVQTLLHVPRTVRERQITTNVTAPRVLEQLSSESSISNICD